MIGPFVKVVNVPRSEPLWCFREWRVTSDRVMRSLHRNATTWTKPTKRCGTAITKHSSTGLWAWRRQRKPHWGHGVIHGLVKVWGTVAVHRLGVRAQHMEVVSVSDLALATKLGVAWVRYPDCTRRGLRRSEAKPTPPAPSTEAP